ncbi:hypothetical protein [Fusobacterium periodonticum]|uniref:Uncharacterized protein n=1 Tax=Fusobacterium periodonticum 1_1_41FAA TaxID=469621 RepID=D6LIT7_9FUSO|nr:hypothetical protein [Fusobacterium periodonticum]EFG28313.1 hypothetical protein HMPREF0400_01652 [Fusobacterium periodonticum 1_1_41FAA]
MEMKNENLKEMILKLTQKDIDELMEKTEKEEDKIFYNKLFNLILETKQEELIKKGYTNEKSILSFCWCKWCWKVYFI